MRTATGTIGPGDRSGGDSGLRSVGSWPTDTMTVMRPISWSMDIDARFAM
jgi:hypothetical protein